MAKKKSKTQKYKKNLKEKQKKEQKRILEATEALKQINESGATKAKLAKQDPKVNAKKKKVDLSKKKTLVKKNEVEYNIAVAKKEKKTPPKKRELIEKEDVIYNIPLKKSKKKASSEKNAKDVKIIQKNEPIKTIKKPNKVAPILATILSVTLLLIKKIGIILKTCGIKIWLGLKLFGKKLKELFIKIKQRIVENKAKRVLNKEIKPKPEKIIVEEPIIEEQEEVEEIDKEELRRQKQELKRQEMKKKNVFIRLIYDIVSNRHILFNAVLILFFIVLLVGLIRIEVISKGTIIYISIIAIFLMTVAISYNRYLSGKIYTIVLCTIMGFAIYRMQYTYDFIRNLNSTVYEYKTYYIVTFNNSQNKSIYNINNKKVGLLKENTINIERKLNTKLDKVNYIEYDNLNDLYNDFYNQNFRAILVNENQYKYMKNHINPNAREVKILYEFKANAKK